MEVRDPVHGSIFIEKTIEPIVNHRFFKRLRGIKQLGLSEYVFPGATHTRYIHSLGVMSIAERAFDRLFKDYEKTSDLLRLKETLKIAALLHDIGHAPLSHSTELVMPKVQELKLPVELIAAAKDRQATHEDYTLKAIADSSFTQTFQIAIETFGINPICIAELILGKTHHEKYFSYRGINYFPMFHQLVSSELDCDRMDYLLRDSYFCGVSYGHFDLDWTIDNLAICILNDQAFLGINERAVSTFDDFLLCRYHMFVMVYFHYKSVCLENLLARFFNTSDEYKIPADIENYQDHDDHFLMNILRKSKNKYAQNIVENKIPTKLYESFNQTQVDKLNQLENYMIEQKIEYIKSSSKGRLSKYYVSSENNQKNSIKVLKSYPSQSQPNVINIDQATDLFAKYSSTHSINRIHCWKSELQAHQLDFINQVITQ